MTLIDHTIYPIVTESFTDENGLEAGYAPWKRFRGSHISGDAAACAEQERMAGSCSSTPFGYVPPHACTLEISFVMYIKIDYYIA
jgi:hypothetical protein